MSDLTSNTLLSLNRIGVSVGFPQWGMSATRLIRRRAFDSHPSTHVSPVQSVISVSAFELAMRIGDFDKAHRLIAMEVYTFP